MGLFWREYVATATFRNPCRSFAMTSSQRSKRARGAARGSARGVRRRSIAERGMRRDEARGSLTARAPGAACALAVSGSRGTYWHRPAFSYLYSRHSLRIASGGHSQQACSRALVAHVCRSLSCIRSVRYSDYGSVASQHSDAGRPSRCGARPTGTWAYAGDRRWRHACGGWRGADLFSRSGLQGEGMHKSFWIHRLACRTAAGRDLSRDGAVARWRWDCV